MNFYNLLMNMVTKELLLTIAYSNRKKEHQHVVRIDFEFMHGVNQEKDCFNTQLQVNKRLDVDEFQDGFARAACARIVRNAKKSIKPDELNAFIVTFTRV